MIDFYTQRYALIALLAAALFGASTPLSKPLLDAVPPMLLNKLDRIAAAYDVAGYLSLDSEATIIADWPEDIALFCRLLLVGETEIVDVRRLRFEFRRTPGFSTARNSRVPHTALHDARALRDHLMALED